jgi:hypothetical protein
MRNMAIQRITVPGFAISLVGAGVMLLILAPHSRSEELYGKPPPNIAAHIEGLINSYPKWISRREGNLLIMQSGEQFPISDGRENKTFDELLEHPDIDDMFYLPYPAGSELKQPPKNFDPGRVRFQRLFDAMYRDCKKGGVGNNLKSIAWLPKHSGGKVAITTVNRVDKALESVSTELDELDNNFLKYLKPSSGTYNCRSIAGTDVKSMHSYGAAIDINAKYSNYWRWAHNLNDPKWENQIPIEIVKIFEKHGFVWGGFWYHYDTMHFEYRPELLVHLPWSGTTRRHLPW